MNPSLTHQLFLLKYNIRTGWNFLLRHRRTALLNLAGLVIGLVAILMIHLYIQFETSYDHWIPDAERIFRIEGPEISPDGSKIDNVYTPWAMLRPLKKQFPEIVSGTRILPSTTHLMVKGFLQKQDLAIVDSGFTDIFKFPIVAGSLQQTLTSKSEIAISETLAGQLFAGQPSIGRVIDLPIFGHIHSYRVSAIFKALPVNSHFSMNLILPVSADYFSENMYYFNEWGALNFFTYIKLRSKHDATNIDLLINDTLDHVANLFDSRRFKDAYHFSLMPIEKIHLNPRDDTGFSSPPGNQTVITAFQYVIIVLLTMIVVNFINLTTTEASGRVREMSIRRIFGGQKHQLLVQLLIETAIIMALAVIAALLITTGFSWVFNIFLNTHFAVQLWGTNSVVPVLTGLMILLTLIGGFYPAMTTVGADLANALSDRHTLGSPRVVKIRKALVCLQFFLAIGLIICTGTITLQTIFGETDSPGFNTKGLYTVDHLDKTISAQQKNDFFVGLQKILAVKAVTHSDINIFALGFWQNSLFKSGSNSGGALHAEYYAIDYNTFATFGIPLIAGRSFSADKPEDTVPSFEYEVLKNRNTSIMLNETAAKAYGFVAAETAIGKRVYLQSNTAHAKYYPATIIGVVGDARFGSLHTPVPPAYYLRRPTGFTSFTMRIAPGHRAQTIAAIKTLFQTLFPDRGYEAGFIADLMAEQTIMDTLKARAFILFSCLSVAIAALGLFGLAAYIADSRRQEISVRRVFGAGLGHITRLLMREFTQPILWASLIAWPVAWWAMHIWLAGFSKHIDTPVMLYLAAAVGGLELATLTVVWHVWKIKNTDMADSLRYE